MKLAALFSKAAEALDADLLARFAVLAVALMLLAVCVGVSAGLAVRAFDVASG